MERLLNGMPKTSLPIGAIGIAIIYFFFHMPVEEQKFKDRLKRIDYAGNLLVLVAGTLFLLAMNFGGQTYPWGSAAVIVSERLQYRSHDSDDELLRYLWFFRAFLQLRWSSLN